MIVLEGMDGTGKTTLLGRLVSEFPWVALAPRAANSDGTVRGGFSSFAGYGRWDVSFWDESPVAFYDRHPFVSEPIYGTLNRGGVDPDIFGDAYDQFWAQTLVVVADPGIGEVLRNLSDPGIEQKQGVVEAARELHAAYESLEGVVRYDYGDPGSYSQIVQAVSCHADHWCDTV